MKQHIILYYKFNPITNPEDFRDKTKEFCEKHNLLGRIIITKNGINGTLGGKKEAIENYKEFLHSYKGFEDVWFKEHVVGENPFPRLKVRSRDELCTLRSGELNPKDGGKHLSPKEVNEMVEKGEAVFFDARNDYESAIGKFDGAITPNIRTFYDLPKVLPQYKEQLKGKKVIMYCTGGVRCETASVLLKNEGIEDVYQVEGGIYNYCQEYPQGHFKGSCFVFDDRMQVAWDKEGNLIDHTQMKDEDMISECVFCQKKCARVINDERYLERVATICCEECDLKNDLSRPRTKEERKEMILNQKR